MKYVRILLVLATIACVSQARHKTVIIGMSGLRHDYVEKSGLPTFHLFQTAGVHALEMSIPMVTNSWPSLCTLSTGLWPEEHGIIDDTMYDPQLDRNFHAGYTDLDTQWMPSKPIWISAEMDGVRTVVSGWPGAELVYNGKQATNYTKFIAKETEEQTNIRMDKFVADLTDGADLGLFLVPEPDNTAHKTGANSEQTNDALKANDRLLSYFLKSLELNGIDSKTNIIVVGDHGMTDHTSDKVIYLPSSGVRMGDFRWVTGNLFTTGMLRPRENLLESTFKKLSNRTEFMNVYLRENLPEKFHLKHHRRTPPIVLVPHLGYRIQLLHPPSDSEHQAIRTVGMHGYSNEESDMKPAMLAYGPDFKKKKLDTFRSIDIYPMVCSLLELKSCHGTDGSLTAGQEIVNMALEDNRAAKLNYKMVNTGEREKTKKRKIVAPSSAGTFSVSATMIGVMVAALMGR